MNEPKDLPRSLAGLCAARREAPLSPVEAMRTLLEPIEVKDAQPNAPITVPPERAPVEAKALFIDKTNTHEFAYGLTNDRS